MKLRLLDQLRVLNHLRLQELRTTAKLTDAIDTHRGHAMIDSVCSDDIVERVRAEIAIRGIDVGFDLSGAS